MRRVERQTLSTPGLAAWRRPLAIFQRVRDARDAAVSPIPLSARQNAPHSVLGVVHHCYAAGTDAGYLEDDFAVLCPCKVGCLWRLNEERTCGESLELGFVPHVPIREV